MADKKVTDTESEKKFKVIEVSPEDLAGERPPGRVAESSWGGGDVWPGSASAEADPREGQSAWGGGDVWPGSSAPADEGPAKERDARSGWQISDRWPGSAAPSDDSDEPPPQGDGTTK